jgi:hypothetical protein
MFVDTMLQVKVQNAATATGITRYVQLPYRAKVTRARGTMNAVTITGSSVAITSVPMTVTAVVSSAAAIGTLTFAGSSSGSIAAGNTGTWAAGTSINTAYSAGTLLALGITAAASTSSCGYTLNVQLDLDPYAAG